MKFEIKVQEHMVEKFPPDIHERTRRPIKKMVLCASDPYQAIITLPMPGKLSDKVIKVGCSSLEQVLSNAGDQITMHMQDLVQVAMDEMKPTPPKAVPKPAKPKSPPPPKGKK